MAWRCLEVYPRQIDAAQFKKMDFQEFCTAAISASQYEGLERWEYQTHTAYEIFEREGNRVVMIEDLAKVSKEAKIAK